MSSIPPLRDAWLPALSRHVGERLPGVGGEWREARRLLDRLAEPVPPRDGRFRPQIRAGGPVEEVDLTTSDGLRIAAWFLPAEGRAPVVLHHHFGGTSFDYLPVGRMLREAGHPVLLIDARSHGSSDVGASLGLALAERPLDVIAAVRWLRDRGYPRYHGLGYSMGAAVTMMGASTCGGALSLVLDSGPVTHLGAACRGLIGARLPDEPAALRAVAARRLYLDGRGWRYRLDIDRAAAGLPGVPVLIIHGELDAVIPLAETEELRQRVVRGPCERVVLPGTAHVAGWARHRKRYQALVVDFMRGAEEGR